MLPCTPLLVLMLVWMSDCTGAGAQSIFTVQPVPVIQAEGLEAVFECLHPRATTYVWFMNGLISFDLNFPLDASIGGGLRGSPVTLTIPARPEYNNAVLQCRAVVEVERAPQFVLSDNATLTVQGPLEAVSALVISSRSASSILISWMPPFSLELTTAEPDIVYCVDIYNVTGGGTELVETKCNIIDTSYLFSSDNLSPDHIFNFTVTPVSNVAGSQNGTRSQPIQASTCRGRSNTFSNLEFKSNIHLNPMTFTYSTENGADASMPTSYTVVFKNDTGSSANCSANPTVTNSNTSLTFTNSDCTRSISRHSLYNATIIETYMGGIAMQSEMMSTHDVQSPIITNWSQPGQINISTNYLDGSTDQGFFCLIYSLGDSSHVFYGATVKEKSKDFAITSLPQDEYMVVLYDLEEYFLPRETPAALPQRVPIANNPEVRTPPNVLDDGILEVTSPRRGEVYVNCPVADCVGVIHSMNMDNLTLYHFRNGGRVTGLNEGYYSVVLIKRIVSASTGLEKFSFYSTTVHVDSPLTTSERTPTLQTTDESIIGVVVGTLIGGVLVLMVIVMLTIIVITVKIRKNATNETQSSGASVGAVDLSRTFMGIEQPNQAYSLVLMDNKSYEKVSHRRKRNQQEAINHGQPHTVDQFASGDEVPERPHEYEEIQPHEHVDTQPHQYEDTQPYQYEDIQPHQYEDIQPRCAVPTYVNVHNV